MQGSNIQCLSQDRKNWEGCGRKDIQRKIRGRWRCGHRESGMDASRWIFGASASIIFPGTIKSRRWRAIMEEVDKGCGEFCVTVHTATRTASILIHSRLKALAVNLSRPSGLL